MVHIACENGIFQKRLGISLYYESSLVFTSFVVLGGSELPFPVEW